MQIIPVIDVLNGVVVHAKKGERCHYQPIQSQLTSSHQAIDIIAALLAAYPFTQLYIADLNAIQKLRGCDSNNYEMIAAIKQQFPQLTLWVDAGIRNIAELSIWQQLDVRLIIGSENFTNMADYCALPYQNHILSLDFMPHGYQGPAELLANSAYWPQEVIIMSLAKVGANQGADLALITKIMLQAQQHHIYAAGGIRDSEDLILLKQIGVHGALIATALHQQQISDTQLRTLA